MNVTKDIVKDLLPLYVSGEGSDDTRTLVEAFLRDDPELRHLVDALRASETEAVREVSTAAGGGPAALERTKGLLRRRSWLLAFALLFSGLPLSFVFDGQGFRFVLLRDAPLLGSASLAVGMALWIAYAATARRLRVTGL